MSVHIQFHMGVISLGPYCGIVPELYMVLDFKAAMDSGRRNIQVAYREFVICWFFFSIFVILSSRG